MKKHSLPAEKRIRSKLDFARIYDRQQRFGDQHLLVFAAPNERGHPRVGLSVSKKHGNAVKRARLKRLLREAFRLEQENLPNGLDLILIPRQNSEAGLGEYRTSLVWAANKLGRRLLREDGR